MNTSELLGQCEQQIGEKLGTSDWLTISQQRINDFADSTLDHQVIHINPQAPATQALGGTIAHGFLTLSLLPYLSAQLTRAINADRTVLNYGLNRVRFLTQVASGSDVRLHMTVISVEEKKQGVLVTYSSEIEVRGAAKPALVAEQLILILY